MAMKDEQDTDDDSADVPDPHMGVDQRKREMEAEMNETEKKDLRGGFEDFIKTEPGTSGIAVKRDVPMDSVGVTPPDPKRRPKPAFGADMVKEERLKSLGMRQTTLSSAARPLGKRATTGKGEDDTPGWACQVCTFHNEAVRERCGRYSFSPACRWEPLNIARNVPG